MASEFLDELAAYLVTVSAGWATPLKIAPTAGWNLTAGDFPNEPDTVVTLLEYPGMGPSRVLGGRGTPGPGTSKLIVMPRLQVYVRDLSYPAARGLARQVWDALDDVTNQVLQAPAGGGGADYLVVEPLEDPYQLDEDQGASGARRHVMTFRCQVAKGESA